MKKIIIFFLGISLTIFSASVDDMKEKIKKLDNEIKAKNERIENIDIEKKTIAQQIEEIKKDIEAVSYTHLTLPTKLEV